MLALDDFEHAARLHLPRPIFGYVSGACETGASFKDNRSAFSDIAFVPRALMNVGNRSQAVTLFGRSLKHPFGVSPMGLSALAAYDGDVVLSRAANEAGTFAILSATSLTPLERVASEGGSRWFQSYLPGEIDRIDAMVDRVAAAGFETFVLTVDVPLAGNRENNIRNGFDTPLRPSARLAWQGITHPAWLIGTAMRTLKHRGMPHFENMDAFRGPPILSRNLTRAIGKRDQLAWEHVARIRERWKGNLVLKGILSVDDAVLAHQHGVDGIIVSNHGGRQLDGAISPIRVLPEIAARIRGDMVIMLDSGIRRGSDVLKALACGADFVFVGRPFLFAASTFGHAGVTHAVQLLSEEIDRNMALLGVSRLDDLNAQFLRRIP
ncbi:alpha-hydroxy-acid oxidizing protein [Agrobacterium rubi]|uniref:alpha-hydroxy acid oxidase n=1 Tax=Agrobacterium rubi TaxID=28099 RepID=UPI0015722AD6|nr:alpha-hydroxy acid oxidase [Agrobacterium rubi]NTF08922.1 alpha-hydroxy-acid oxidizing protein [Agrobacterium rubi]NTF21193.1 alpha-hydroxy-acid oxidizing protein [Agrobacterium rubi]NTF28050.1 alpha-hydroxy-acid oxidizing protein [Agrobacterium rubi]